MANGNISSKGLDFIAGWEGFRARLYNDALGHCTIGFGHLVHRGGCSGAEPPGFKDGITRAEGIALLRADSQIAVRAVNAGVHVPLTQHKFDALVSFTFNVGTGAFQGSTLLRVVNEGRHADVPAQLSRWTNKGLPGLVNRRRAESNLYVHGTY
ncbi:lysozyme [Microbacterium sp. W4I20]|uniref:lysozyme n=1 Tax=Microbacterium sp. W4I20 TaxID=3042262 RepID=UPI0027880D77|nr:lysozyme [Microbacterium sp. W4I20]MDQ0728439.1 lysozyme [Microbacterium sp. W4I20]